MTIRQALRRRLLKYLDLGTPERRALSSVLWSIEKQLPDTVIFGGMLREFSLGNARHFVSDIDLVSDATSDEISDALAAYNPTRNKFGGFRFIVERRRFDLWPLKDTWAFRAGHVSPPTFPSLLRTSFFNLDAALFHLGRREVSACENYESWIENRWLEINLEPNPNPEQMVRRTLALVLHNNLSVGPHLKAFLRRQGKPNELSWPQAVVFDRLVAGNETATGIFNYQGGLLNQR